MSNYLIDLLPLTLVLLLFYKARPVKPLSAFNEAYLDMAPCRTVRAFFALAIILHHLSQHCSSGQIFPMFTLFSFTVPIFFFFSGYGIMKKKLSDPNYHKTFIARHIPPLLLAGFAVLILFKLLYLLAGENISFSQLIYMIIHGDIILVILWYLLVIILLYLVFGFALMLFKNGNHILLFMFGFSLVYIYFGNKYQLGQWMYNSFHLLLIGLAWALYEEQVLNFIKRFYWICLFLCGFVFLFVWQYFDLLFNLWPVPEMRLIISLVRNASFTLAFILFTMKIRLGNRILDCLGKVSLELYLLHPLFLLLFRSSILYIGNDLLFCVAVLAGSIIASLLLSQPYNAVCKKYYSLLK